MNAKTVGSILLVLVAFLVLSTPANAVDGPYFAGNGFYPGYWGYNYPSDLYVARTANVPYFSLFPPVYYSYPVARPYGFSPYAYPAGVATPSAGQDMVANGQVRPLRIVNPYVAQASEGGPAEVRGMAAGKPKVVYPAAVTLSAR